MKSLKKLMVLSVFGLVLSACGSNQPSSSSTSKAPEKPTTFEREEDEVVYDRILGSYDELITAAKAETNDNVRYVKYAKAEAALMDAAVFMPTYSRGGTYAMTRVAPRTGPYCMWGNDDDRLKNAVVVNYDANKPFIKGAERAEMIEKWDAARKGGAAYDPVAYLTGKGYTIADKLSTTFNSTPQTLDVLDTSKQRDTESLVNAIEGLLEYDNLGVLQPRLAKALPTLSADQKTYTFEIREDAKWYTSDRQEYAAVTADDFVAGFQHMLDAQAGLEWLVDGVVKGVHAYLAGTGSFTDVGYRVKDGKLEIELEQPESFFLTRLTYSCFMPINRAYFLAKGGAFGVREFAAAKASDSYSFGKVSDPSSNVYNSAFIPSVINNNVLIKYVKNANYYDASKVRINEIDWIYDAGDNPEASYASAKKGDYVGIGLSISNGLIDKAKEDNLFNDYHYVTDTDSTTFFCGFNVNRGNWENGTVISAQGEQNKIDNHYAFQNANFRRALQHAWDRKTWNGVVTGAELAEASLRNIYTAPEFLTLSEDVNFDNHVFAKGTPYGDCVEYFLKNTFKRTATTKDGVDGWYNVDEAKKYLDLAKAECGENWAKVELDVVCYSASKNQVAYARAFKNSIEKALGSDNVQVNIINTTNLDDYYNSGYDAANGEAGNYDVFYGSGWGPDYGDPSTYLDTFLGDGAGYMTKVIGLF